MATKCLNVLQWNGLMSIDSRFCIMIIQRTFAW